MSLLVVGSVAFDAIETPLGKVDRTLGGAASYFALAASHFTPVRISRKRKRPSFAGGRSISMVSSARPGSRSSGRAVTA
jgi:hypothetical protein